MKLQNVTAVIITKNEEENIHRALNSVRFCADTLVIDDYSIDKTVEISRKEGARVKLRHLKENYAEQRNYALKLVTTDWVLFVDADEVVGKELQQEIRHAVANDDIAGFYLLRCDVFNNKLLRHGEWGQSKLLRLAKRNSGGWHGRVHEVWNVRGEVGTLKSPLFHYSHSSIQSFIASIIRYAKIHSLSKVKHNKPFIHTVVYPSAKFVNNYIVHLGFLDGVEGLIYSILMSIHSYMTWNSFYENNKYSK